MPSEDFVECMLYEQIEPFGDRRLDILHGILCSVLFNVNRRDRNTKLTVPADFIPKWGVSRTRPPTASQMMNFMLALQDFQSTKVKAKSG